MIIKLGVLIAASIAAYAIQQISIKRWRASIKSSEKDDASRRQTSDEDNKHHFTSPTHGLKEVLGEEEVKLICGISNQPFSNLPDTEDEISELESLLSGEIDYESPSDNYNKFREFKAERDGIYEEVMADSAAELERLRSLVQELQEREVKLEGELFEYCGCKEQESDFDDLRKQLKMKSVEIDMLNSTINKLQAERKKLQAEVAQGDLARKELEIARNKIKELQRQIQLNANQTKVQLLLLKQQVISLQVKEEEAMKNDTEVEKKLKSVKDLEVEVVELKRLNKELQNEKRELVVKLDAAEAKIKTLSNMSQNDMIHSACEEMNSLRRENDDLQKQVEEFQMNRFSEVEELVYLRWVNACLRYELRNRPTNEEKISALSLSKRLSPRSHTKAKHLMLEYAGSELGQGNMDFGRNLSHRSYSFSEYSDNVSIGSSMSKHSMVSKNSSLIQKLKKWGRSKDDLSILSSPVRSDGGSPRPRVTLETLMKHEGKKNSSPMVPSNSLALDSGSNMFGELQNNSSFQSAVEADVESQDDFAHSLATEVRQASFSNVEDLVAFVNWLDEELHFLVDERAVLKHVDWPESKADALREAAFEYQDLVNLEKQVTSFVDDPSLPCEAALKKMHKLLEKAEQSVLLLLRIRDNSISRYKEFGIPVDWLQDSELIGKIKLSSVQLARNYMNRVAAELDSLNEPEKEQKREFLALQGVRFAFRVHQFTGGFDAESMKAFEELRGRISAQTGGGNKQET